MTKPGKCQLCDDNSNTIKCTQCDQQFCTECDTEVHSDPDFTGHQRIYMVDGKPVFDKIDTTQTSDVRTVLPTTDTTTIQPTTTQPAIQCDLCDEVIAVYKCTSCYTESDGDFSHYCTSCDAQFHVNKQAAHVRTLLSEFSDTVTTTVPSAKTELTALCELCDDTVAVIQCLQCEHIYCDNCSTDMHKPVQMQSHTLTRLDQISTDSVKSNNNVTVLHDPSIKSQHNNANSTVDTNIHTVSQQPKPSHRRLNTDSIQRPHTARPSPRVSHETGSLRDRPQSAVISRRTTLNNAASPTSALSQTVNAAVSTRRSTLKSVTASCTLCHEFDGIIECTQCQCIVCELCDTVLHKPIMMQSHIRTRIINDTTNTMEALASKIWSHKNVDVSNSILANLSRRVTMNRSNNINNISGNNNTGTVHIESMSQPVESPRQHTADQLDTIESTPTNTHTIEFTHNLSHIDTNTVEQLPVPDSDTKSIQRSLSVDATAAESPRDAVSIIGTEQYSDSVDDTQPQIQTIDSNTSLNTNHDHNSDVQPNELPLTYSAPIAEHSTQPATTGTVPNTQPQTNTGTEIHVCDMCDEPVATFKCTDCDEQLCPQCDTDIHRPVKMQSHIRTPLNTHTTQQQTSEHTTNTTQKSEPTAIEQLDTTLLPETVTAPADIQAAVQSNTICELCDEVAAVIQCDECAQPLCESCDAEMHKSTKMQLHHRHAFATNTTHHDAVQNNTDTITPSETTNIADDITIDTASVPVEPITTQSVEHTEQHTVSVQPDHTTHATLHPIIESPPASYDTLHSNVKLDAATDDMAVNSSDNAPHTSNSSTDFTSVKRTDSGLPLTRKSHRRKISSAASITYTGTNSGLNSIKQRLCSSCQQPSGDGTYCQNCGVHRLKQQINDTTQQSAIDTLQTEHNKTVQDWEQRYNQLQTDMNDKLQLLQQQLSDQQIQQNIITTEFEKQHLQHQAQHTAQVTDLETKHQSNMDTLAEQHTEQMLKLQTELTAQLQQQQATHDKQLYEHTLQHKQNVQQLQDKLQQQHTEQLSTLQSQHNSALQQQQSAFDNKLQAELNAVHKSIDDNYSKQINDYEQKLATLDAHIRQQYSEEYALKQLKQQKQQRTHEAQLLQQYTTQSDQAKAELKQQYYIQLCNELGVNLCVTDIVNRYNDTTALLQCKHAIQQLLRTQHEYTQLNDMKQYELQQKQQQIDTINHTVQSLQEQLQTVQTMLSQATQQYNTLNNEHHTLQQQHVIVQAENSTLHSEKQGLIEQLTHEINNSRQLQQELYTHKQLLQSINDSLQHIQSNNSTLQQHITELTVQLQQSHDTIESLNQQIIDQQNKLQQNEILYTVERTALNNELTTAKHLLSDQLQQYQAEQSSVLQHITDVEKRHSVIESELDDERQKQTELTKQLQSAQQQYTELQHQYQHSHVQYTELQAKLDAQIRNYDILKNESITALNQNDHTIQQHKNTVERLQQQLQYSDEQMKQLEHKGQQLLSEKNIQLQHMENTLKTNETEKTQLQSELNQLQHELRTVQQNLTQSHEHTVQTEQSLYHTTQQYQALQQQYSELQNKNTALQSTIDTLGRSEIKHIQHSETITNQYTALQTEIQQLQHTITQLNEKLQIQDGIIKAHVNERTTWGLQPIQYKPVDTTYQSTTTAPIVFKQNTPKHIDISRTQRMQTMTSPIQPQAPIQYTQQPIQYQPPVQYTMTQPLPRIDHVQQQQHHQAHKHQRKQSIDTLSIITTGTSQDCSTCCSSCSCSDTDDDINHSIPIQHTVKQRPTVQSTLLHLNSPTSDQRVLANETLQKYNYLPMPTDRLHNEFNRVNQLFDQSVQKSLLLQPRPPTANTVQSSGIANTTTNRTHRTKSASHKVNQVVQRLAPKPARLNVW